MINRIIDFSANNKFLISAAFAAACIAGVWSVQNIFVSASAARLELKKKAGKHEVGISIDRIIPVVGDNILEIPDYQGGGPTRIYNQ